MTESIIENCHLSEKEKSMEFGCCIREPENILRVKEAGFDYYEYAGSAVAAMSDKAFTQMLTLAEKAAFPCRGFNAYSAGVPAIVGERYDPRQVERYAALVCSRGARLGVSSLGIGAPAARRLPTDFPRDRADAQCREFLSITCEAAARNGLRVLLEAVHSRMCDYINTTAEALAMVRQVGCANLSLVLDFYHMEVMEEELDAVALVAPMLSHVHVSTCGDDLSRDFPGEGESSFYIRRFQALHAISYDKTISIEPDHYSGAAASSLAMLKAAWRDAGPQFIGVNGGIKMPEP